MININNLKNIIKSLSFTSLLFICSAISTSLLLNSYYSINKNTGKKQYKRNVAPYPYVLKEYEKINYNKKKITSLLDETWMRKGWDYEGRTTFKETARTGEHVNISNFGFRRNEKNNPNDNFFKEKNKLDEKNLIYFFGGSTSFGYGVPDQHTIPSYLEKISNKNLKVFNFGRGFYYSQQENDLLDELLKRGAPVPKIAIFLNGVNERCWGTAYEPQFKRIFAKASYSGYKWEANEYAKPFIYIISKLIKNKSKVGSPFFDENCKNDKSKFSSDINLINIYRKNLIQRKNLCKQYGLECITFIQPFPNDLNIHKHNNLKGKQKRLLLTNNTKDLRMKIEDISDSLSNYKDHAYVDDVHYSPKANEVIALEIYKRMGINFPNLIN